MKRYGDLFGIRGMLTRAIVTGDWKDFGYQVLNMASVAISALSGDIFGAAAGILSFYSRAISHIGGNAADEISRALGYAAMAAGAISIVKSVASLFTAPTAAGDAAGGVGSQDYAIQFNNGLKSGQIGDTELANMYNSVRSSVAQKIASANQLVSKANYLTATAEALEAAKNGAGWIQLGGLGMLLIPGAEPAGVAVLATSGTIGTGLGVAHGAITGSAMEVGTSLAGQVVGKVAAQKALSVAGMVESRFNAGAVRYIANATGRFVKTASGAASVSLQASTESLTGTVFDIFGQVMK